MLPSKVLQSARHILIPCDLRKGNIDTIFQMASLLKQGKKVLSLKNKVVTLLINEHDLKAQAAIFKAAREFHMSVNVIFDRQMTRDNMYIEDAGRLLSQTSDIVMCKLIRHVRTPRLATHSTIPIINVRNRRYSIVQVLMDLFTVKERFGVLEGLTLAWVGPPGALVNTYLPFAAALGLNIRYFCLCNSSSEYISPQCLYVVKEICTEIKSTIIECSDCVDALKGAHVICTRNHSNDRMKITTESVKLADEKWIVVHPLPRGKHEIEEKIFNGPRNLTFESFSNAVWICGALICHCLGIVSKDMV